MAALSCLLLLLSVVYGALSCDPKIIALFTKNPLDLITFSASTLFFKAASTNLPEYTSAMLQVGAVNGGNAEGVVTLYEQQNRNGGFIIHFSQTDGNPLTGLGFIADTTALKTYYVNAFGNCHATYICDNKDSSFGVYTISYRDSAVCSDSDYQQSLAVIKQANSAIEMRAMSKPPV